MKITRVLLLLIFSILSPVLSVQALAGIYDELTPDQQVAIQKGEQVVVTQDVSGIKWPKVFVYQRIDSTPEEAMAVMADVERHINFFPDLKKSKISKRIDRATVQVDYTLNLPWPVGDENYTVEDHLSSYDNGAAYQVEWKMIRADSTKAIQGHVRFEQLGSSTIMAYYNFVVPGAWGSGWVKDRAMQAVKDASAAITRQTEKERVSDQKLLQKQIESLREALAQVSSWAPTVTVSDTVTGTWEGELFVFNFIDPAHAIDGRWGIRYYRVDVNPGFQQVHGTIDGQMMRLTFQSPPFSRIEGNLPCGMVSLEYSLPFRRVSGTLCNSSIDLRVDREEMVKPAVQDLLGDALTAGFPVPIRSRVRQFVFSRIKF